ncbi:tRNA (adenosine(37)-N6)-threonylcarbamoyltransferase complex dimerization subunit type 1 TsaB, partial [bacterium]|nr:tRNA (adenosine(37)-N6)-threonylcarbamoyltransferase complex dimerization subunit type 1 TsaB [candidate division CSSED10-310 bacterium]
GRYSAFQTDPGTTTGRQNQSRNPYVETKGGHGCVLHIHRQASTLVPRTIGPPAAAGPDLPGGNMKLLAFDTTAHARSLALAVDGIVIAAHTHSLRSQHSARLIPDLQGLLAAVDLAPKDLDMLVIVRGPGSFTSIRVGMTTAKTLAYSLHIPIIAVDSLETTAYALLPLYDPVCVLLDARKKEVYAACYRLQDGDPAATFGPLVLPVHEVPAAMLESHLVTGTALGPYGAVLHDLTPAARRAPEHYWLPRAEWGLRLAMHRLANDTASPVTDFSALAALTPRYLRKPDAEVNWEKKYGTKA